MGQLIEVEHTALGAIAIFDTDRSFSGQDGETFSTADQARAAETFSGVVAADILDHDSAVRSVYVYSNAISVDRSGEWSDDALDSTAEVIRNSLVHYDENRD